MNKLTANNAPWIALLLSGGLLIGAWVFQYGFNYAPCQMCYWQRHAHKAVLAIAVIALIAARIGFSRPRFFALLLLGALLVSAGIAFWHMGVEYKWWEGPKTCLAGGLSDSTGLALLDQLDKKINPPACADAVWHFLGLSMAAWNGIISTIGAALMGICLGQRASNDR